MNKKQKTYSNKTELALSALMFFSPLIQNLIKKNNINIEESEKNFLNGYIKLGYFNIILLGISVFFQIIYYTSNNKLFQSLGIILSIVLGISLVIGSVYAILNKEILGKNNEKDFNYKDEKLLDNILYYIPVYNVYKRYNEHKFENPNILLKESLLLRTVFTVFLLIFPGENLIIILILIVALRIISIANGLYGGEKFNIIINKIFKKNPEEIWGYILGVSTTLFNGKKITENISNIKQKFELIPKIDYKQILSQYLILLILLGFLFYLGVSNNNINLIFAALLITGRYGVMIIKRKHVPNIPILKEFVNLFFKNKNEKKI
ncbi:MAG: hypothetical protein M0P94_00980 [Candidatus Absconditabacterales bacterium]|nr:hypothetical protein [Candidatus Absconditabacterales bacterium]